MANQRESHLMLCFSHPWGVVLHVHVFPLHRLLLSHSWLLLDAMTCVLMCWGLCSRSGQTLRVFNSAVISFQISLKTRCSLKQAGSRGPDWLISQSPEVLTLLGILSSFTRGWLLPHLHIAQRAAQQRGIDVGGGCSSSLPSPEALHMELTASHQLAVFCAAIIVPCFLKNKEKGVKNA